MENLYIDIPATIEKCAKDIMNTDSLTLDAQTRAYRLLDAMLSDSLQSYRQEDRFVQAAELFTGALESKKIEYDEVALKKELADRLAPIEADINEARFRAAAAESLHEFAKEVWEIWQNSGVFARRRALKELRQSAGFRLESHRIGNYVAKTFDLMNEAHAQFAKAQQAKFSADVSYMIQPDIYEKIQSLLK